MSFDKCLLLLHSSPLSTAQSLQLYQRFWSPYVSSTNLRAEFLRTKLCPIHRCVPIP